MAHKKQGEVKEIYFEEVEGPSKFDFERKEEKIPKKLISTFRPLEAYEGVY